MTISRRDFLKASSLFATFAALSACTPQSSATETAAPSITGHSLGTGSIGVVPTSVASPTAAASTEDALTVLTLNRISFGPTPEMYDRVAQIGLAAFIDEQLQPETISDTATDQVLSRFTTLGMTPAQLFQLPKQQYGQPALELTAATIFRQWHSQRQLNEVMVDFWTNHFNIYIGKGFDHFLKTDDDQKVIRPNAFAKFGDILNASAHSPAMLFYLDNAESRKEAPNENYARELMELHTISVTGGYTQQDVHELARVFTGWSIVGPNNPIRPAGTYQFVRPFHDVGSKQVLNLTIPAGGGEDEGMKVLDMLAHHPMTAQFLSAKLARRFVSDNPDPALVSSLASVFTQSDGDTRGLLQAIFHSDAFKNSAGQKLKRPLEFMASALRMTNAVLTGQSQQLVQHVRLLGQIPFTWQFPNGFPDTGAYWATTSGLLERWNFAMLLTSGRIAGTQVDIKGLAKDAQTPQDVVDVLSQRFLGGKLPDNARSILLNFASSGDLGKQIVNVAGLILGSPHFQVR